MPKIVVVQPMGVSKELLNELRQLGNVTYHDTPCKDGNDWLGRVNGADIIFTNFSGFNEGWRGVKDVFITLSFVGVGFLDIEVLKRNHVLAANSPGCNQIAVTEWIVAMLINHSRNLSAAIGMTRLRGPAPIGRSLFGKSVAIIGKGNIGNRLGRLLGEIGMNVDYYTRRDSLGEKIGNADFIIDCLSLNTETQNFYNDSFFAQARDSVVFVSIGPNETQDLDAIERNLTAGKIKHFITDNGSAQLYGIHDQTYQRLLSNPKVTVTPHMAAYADNTAETANRICVENIRGYLNGHPVNLIDKL